MINKKAELPQRRAMRHIYGYLKNLREPEYAHGYFSQNFKSAFVVIDPMNVRTKFEVRSFTHS